MDRIKFWRMLMLRSAFIECWPDGSFAISCQKFKASECVTTVKCALRNGLRIKHIQGMLPHAAVPRHLVVHK